MLYADVATARRIEASVVEDMQCFTAAAQTVFPEAGATSIEVGGGIAAFVGSGSPVNQANGLGMLGRVDTLELQELERFYWARGERGTIGVCPLADPGLIVDLGRRGWRPVDFESVLFRPLLDGAPVDVPDSRIEIRLADGDEELATWARAVAEGFAAPEEPTIAEMRLARIAAAREGAEHLLAFVDGRVAGTGELIVSGGLGWLTADTTLPEFRQRGVQTALQRFRLQRALELGCDTAVTEAKPGSGSQRNMERHGFRIAYTRVNLLGPVPRTELA